MAKQFERTVRLNRLIQREIAEMIQHEIKDPRLGMITISDVKTTKDLAYAKVYFTLIGSEDKVKENLDVLNHAAGFIRSQLAKRMHMRTVPQLTFIYDDTAVKAIRLTTLINQAVAEQSDESEQSAE